MTEDAHGALLFAFTMEIKTEPITEPSHGFALLKELDLQRRRGTFCDCVLRVHVQPDRHFTAHKSVLAAFSPVIATLLPQHGAFLDLTSPLLTPETLSSLLDYMYTGALPPESQEEAILNAAFHLQMAPLQRVLTCRRKENEVTHNVQDQTNSTKGFTENASKPPPAKPSYEVVPVIRLHKTTGSTELPLQAHDKDKKFFPDPSCSKHDEAENSLHDIPSVVANEPENFPSNDQFESTVPRALAPHRPIARNQDRSACGARTSNTRLSPGPDQSMESPKRRTDISLHDLKTRRDVKASRRYGPALETLTGAEFGEDMSYQGHIRYHCFPKSDSGETWPGHKNEGNATLLAEVLISKSEARRFQCTLPECEKAFSQRGSLNRHVRSHLGIRPYPCPLCTMTFSRQYRVTEHMRVHQRSCDDPP